MKAIHTSEKMPCRLCKRNRKLLNSHVIPEFIYGALYDEIHRFHVISENKRNSLLQKGIREHLLCSECETLLSRNENYASSIFSGNISLNAKKEGAIIFVEGVDYTQFKLFALSILWRASVSSLPMFSQVQLGSHEEALRQIIASGSPGSSHDYPFFISPLFHEGKSQSALIVSPTWTRIDGRYSYRFVFGGMAWIFVVSNHKLPDDLVNASISETGKMTMIEWELSDMPFIVDFAQKLQRQGKL